MKKEQFNKRLRNFLLCILPGLLCLGCSKNEDSHTESFYYVSDTLLVNFRSQGNIPAPTVQWGDGEAIFSLKDEMDGLAINEVTGAITWLRHLTIGEHKVVVNAEVGDRSYESSFIINNVLKEAFWSGGHNLDLLSDEVETDRSYKFYNDGTMEVEIYGSPDSKGVGVWEMDADQITMRYCTYCENMDPFSVPSYDEHIVYQGTLENEEFGAFITGQWSVLRFNPDSESVRGNFFMEWD